MTGSRTQESPGDTGTTWTSLESEPRPGTVGSPRDRSWTWNSETNRGLAGVWNVWSGDSFPHVPTVLPGPRTGVRAGESPGNGTGYSCTEVRTATAGDQSTGAGIERHGVKGKHLLPYLTSFVSFTRDFPPARHTPEGAPPRTAPGVRNRARDGRGRHVRDRDGRRSRTHRVKTSLVGPNPGLDVVLLKNFQSHRSHRCPPRPGPCRQRPGYPFPTRPG